MWRLRPRNMAVSAAECCGFGRGMLWLWPRFAAVLSALCSSFVRNFWRSCPHYDCPCGGIGPALSLQARNDTSLPACGGVLDCRLFMLVGHIMCYAHSGDIDRAVQTLEDHLSSRPPAPEFYVSLAEGAMEGYSEKGMKVAQETLEKMNARGFFLNAKMGNDLLLAASGEKTGGFTTANYVWDLMQSRKVPVNLGACDAYYNGLKERDIPADDPRLLLVKRTWENLKARFGPARP